jgi:GntR family transcriptional regulator
MMTLLESRLGHRLKSTHIETSAMPAGKLRARHLAIAPGDPVLHIRFTPHDVSDQPLVHADMYFRGDGFSYKAVVKR